MVIHSSASAIKFAHEIQRTLVSAPMMQCHRGEMLLIRAPNTSAWQN